MLTIAVMLGMIMAIIDTTIVNVAIAKIGGNLGASIDEVAWVATGYLLSAVMVMPLNGWLTAFLGRKRFYATSVVIFTLASVLCGTATNIWQLVAYRAIQGIGGGALQPTAQAILFESYPPGKRAQAMALFGLGAMVGPAIGPLLGGYIVANYDWPLIFFINLPIGIVAFFMTLAYVNDPHYLEKPKGAFDWQGLTFMVVGLSALQYVLERGQHDDWFNSGLIVALTCTAAIALTCFVYRETTVASPLVDLRIFANRTFAAGNVVGVVSGFGLFGLNLILPLFMQTLLGWDAWQTGVALLPGAIATAVSMILVGQLSRFAPPRLFMGSGIIMFAGATWMMTYLDQTAGFWDLFWPRALQGLALGFLFVPLSVVTMAGLKQREIAGASGITTLIRQLGGSFGIALLITYLTNDTQRIYASLSDSMNIARPQVAQAIASMQQQFSSLGYAATQAHALAVNELAQQVQLNATAIAYEDLFRVTAFLFIVTLPTLLLLRQPSKPSTAKETR
jgi:MFS transporter, DHA2 family, multidrug resistance protein